MKPTKKNAWETLSKYLRALHQVCQVCRCRQSDVVHHVIKKSVSNALRYDLMNLLTICRVCHNKFHAPMRNRKEWEDTERAEILIRIIGVDGIRYLEDRRHDMKHWSRTELAEIIEKYQKALKELNT